MINMNKFDYAVLQIDIPVDDESIEKVNNEMGYEDSFGMTIMGVIDGYEWKFIEKDAENDEETINKLMKKLKKYNCGYPRGFVLRGGTFRGVLDMQSNMQHLDDYIWQELFDIKFLDINDKRIVVFCYTHIQN